MGAATILGPADAAGAERILRGHGWLSLVPPPIQDAVMARTSWYRLESGTLIPMAAGEAGGMVGIATGSIAVIPGQAPEGLPVIDIRLAPFWFGTRPVTSRKPRGFMLAARGETIAAAVADSAVAELTRRYPEFWHDLARQSDDIIDLAISGASDLLIRDSQTRCVAVLLRIADRRYEGDDAATIEVRQEELAAMANLSRQTAGHLLRDLESKGLIALGYRSITVLAPEELRTMVANAWR
jgi:CRP-like cAMP-binding protein